MTNLGTGLRLTRLQFLGIPVGTVLFLCAFSVGREGSKLRAGPRESRHPSSNQDRAHTSHMYASGVPSLLPGGHSLYSS